MNDILWCLACLSAIGLTFVFGVIVGFAWGEHEEREEWDSEMTRAIEELKRAMMHDYE